MAVVPSGGRGSRRSRDYPPLAAAALAALVLLAVFPSSLNLPQTAPTEQVEFAPVPPEDDVNPPPQGNFSSLSLAGGNTIGSDGRGGASEADSGGEVLGGRAKNPATKRCVGNPPRQSDDPLSPPCVAFFNGDTHGETYQGVPRDEIRVLVYVDCCITYLGGSRGQEATPQNTYVDLGEPPKEDEHAFARALRMYQRHFNERYQTYGRFVRFIVYFRTQPLGPEPRKSDAIDNYRTVKPFAVLSYVSDNAESYLDVLQRKGVIAFGGTSGHSGVFVGLKAEHFRRKPGLAWGFLASLEQYGSMYTSLVCDKVVPYPVSFSGNSGDAGKPRKFGLLWSSDESFPALRAMKDLVQREVRECGGEIVAEASFPDGGNFCCSQGNAEAGTAAFADFIQKGVTTVLWPGGMDTQLSKQAGSANYYPEWVVLGDTLHDTNEHGHLMDPEVWRHAWLVSSKPLQIRDEDRPCFQSAREADPSSERRDVVSFGCELFYNDVRQMFTGIQVAGPRLNPETMDRGFHAIPRRESSSTQVPACFYDPGDYTCVKDAQAMWWDPETPARGTGDAEGAGCWMSAQAGRRFLAAGWPKGDLGAFDSPSDPCNQLG